jgi:hypothetical protein
MIDFDEDIIDGEAFDDNLKKIDELSDGSVLFEIGEDAEEELERESVFYENLADYLDESLLGKLSIDLLDGIEQDKESREQWEESIETGMKYLGIKLEDFKNSPWISASRVFDTTLLSSVLRCYSTVWTSLFPDTGPANVRTAGESDAFLEDQAERIKLFMNYSLTQLDKEYYPDCKRSIFYTAIVGTTFRKVYLDPILNRPVSRFIDPQDFIVNNNCVSLLSSDRLTHVLHLSRKDVLLRQAKGLYRDISLPYDTDDIGEDQDGIKSTVQNLEGIEPPQMEPKSSLVTLYEVHCDICLDGEDSFSRRDDEKLEIPLPYIVTICASSKKILSIYRNWDQNDPSFSRKNYFVPYNYLPGLGLYGMGLTQMIGSNSVAATSVLRQLIDKGTLCNFPGGIRVKGMRLENNDKPIGPGEFLEIETGGLPIRDAISPLPYSEPSQVLRELRNDLIQQTESLASIAETKIAEDNPTAPVGTTMMNLEVANKLQSVVLSSFRESLSYELQLIYDLWGECLPDAPYPFRVPGKETAVMRRDFNDRIQIIPVSDPVLMTNIQKNVQNQSILQLAQAHPQFFNMKSVIVRLLEGWHVRDIDTIMINQEQAIPLDPVSENVNALKGNPLVTALWQDHASHIISHTDFEMKHPEASPILRPHIIEHMADMYLITTQQELGHPLPPLEQMKDPQLQNMIAFQVAQAVQQQQQEEQQRQQAQQGQPLNAEQIAMLDIQQRQQAAELKLQEAQLRAETEAFKAQLNFESEKNKQENERVLMEEKLNTDLEIQKLKMEERGNDYV